MCALSWLILSIYIQLLFIIAAMTTTYGLNRAEHVDLYKYTLDLYGHCQFVH